MVLSFSACRDPKIKSYRVPKEKECRTTHRNQPVLPIYMNNPLRYAGLTFYRAGFGNDDKTTILQVVRNPSWTMPCIACTLMTLGLIIQFGIHLFAFIGRRRRVAPVAA